jgi:hypothetical protein
MSFKAYHLSEERSLRLEVGEEGVWEALEDCASSQVDAPKVDDFGDHLFIMVHDIDCTSVCRQLVTPTPSLLG